MLEYIKYKQQKLDKKTQRAAELEAKKEAARVAKMEAEARKQEEIAARKKLLLEQQEDERLRQKHIQRKEKLAEQKWNKQFDTLLAQVKDRRQKDNKLEEIRVIIQNREPSLQELDWVSWLTDPLNQRLANLDFDSAVEMFKRDNLMAKRRKRTGGKKKLQQAGGNVLSFTGDTAASATDDYVSTGFNPDDYNLNLGFTVSYWVRADETGTHMFAFGRKYDNNQRFTFGISGGGGNPGSKIYVGVGGNKYEGTWESMDANALFPSLFNDEDPPELKTGNWIHFAVTYEDREETGSNVARKTYFNGVLVNEANIDWSKTGGEFTDDGMYFGGRNLRQSGGTPKYNNGLACGLSQVAIFNTEKKASWVTDVYNTDKFKLDLSGESGLVGYWKFDEGSGTTVTDYSGNGNHGAFGAISGDTTGYPTWEEI